MAARGSFDPRAALAALERNYVDYVVIGGLARVLRGADEVTDGLDICPLCSAVNLDRLGAALGELGVRGRGRGSGLDAKLADQPVVGVTTEAGALNLIASSTGAANGFVDLRRGASKEDLGGGLRPLVASTGDLARMAAALGRDRDLARLRELRRIMELEVGREPIVGGAPASSPATGRRATRSPRISR
jgi:hypothetical protein